MSLNEDLSYIYQKVLTKVHYDKEKNKYIIYKEDYMNLNLTNRQLDLLRKMCQHSKIELENYEYRLPSVEDEKIFQEYNELKQLVKNNPTNKELEERRIYLRNQIVSTNLELVRAIIDRNFENIHTIQNKEEIYQLGYEILLDFVDNRDIIYPHTFTKYLSNHLIVTLKNKLIFLTHGYTTAAVKEVGELSKAKTIISSTNPHPTAKDLSRKTELQQRRVEELLNLESLINTISIESEIDSINKQEENDNSPLYDDTFEKNFLLSTARELIIKIINTLPIQQREVILLLYGFKDGKCYNDAEIAKMLNLSNTRIGIVKQEAIENLKITLRSKYLKEAYDIKENIEFSTSKKQEYTLEETLIDHIPKEEMAIYLTKLSEIERKIITLYHGLETGTKINLAEIAKSLGLSASKAYNLKRLAYQKIRHQIIQKHLSDYPRPISYEDCLDYMMQIYIIKTKPKRR